MTTIITTTRTLADYTKPALLDPRLKGGTIPAVMQALSQLLQQADHSLPDLSVESQAALHRELLTGVDLTLGTMFPRVRAAGAQRPRFAVGHLADPLQWLAKFYPPTQMVFLLVEPNTSVLEAEQLAETVTRLRRDPVILSELRLAQTAEEMLAVLGRVSLVNAEELARVQARQLQRVGHHAGSGFSRDPSYRR